MYFESGPLKGIHNKHYNIYTDLPLINKSGNFPSIILYVFLQHARLIIYISKFYFIYPNTHAKTEELCVKP